MGWRLSAEEDAELRRLHVLVQYADAAPWLVERYRQLRARDRRSDVRDLDDDEIVHVVPHGAGDDDDDETGPAGPDTRLPGPRQPYPD